MAAPFTTVNMALPLGDHEPAPVAAPAVTFEEVFADTAPFVWRALRGLGVQDADVEDVCQEVFLVVCRRLSTYQRQCAVRTWVYGICIRVASDYRRRVRHRREQALDDVLDPEALGALGPERVSPANQEAELDRRRALVWLDGVLDRLEDAKRDVFVLFEIEQLAMADVATAVGCPLPTAYARLYAARKLVEAAARREQARWSER